jgi:hypothetical protein
MSLRSDYMGRGIFRLKTVFIGTVYFALDSGQIPASCLKYSPFYRKIQSLPDLPISVSKISFYSRRRLGDGKRASWLFENLQSIIQGVGLKVNKSDGPAEYYRWDFLFCKLA